jgi:hypothetical protein
MRPTKPPWLASFSALVCALVIMYIFVLSWTSTNNPFFIPTVTTGVLRATPCHRPTQPVVNLFTFKKSDKTYHYISQKCKPHLDTFQVSKFCFNAPRPNSCALHTPIPKLFSSTRAIQAKHLTAPSPQHQPTPTAPAQHFVEPAKSLVRLSVNYFERYSYSLSKKQYPNAKVFGSTRAIQAKHPRALSPKRQSTPTAPAQHLVEPAKPLVCLSVNYLQRYSYSHSKKQYPNAPASTQEPKNTRQTELPQPTITLPSLRKNIFTTRSRRPWETGSNTIKNCYHHKFQTLNLGFMNSESGLQDRLHQKTLYAIILHHRDLLFLTSIFRLNLEENPLVEVATGQKIHGKEANATCSADIISDFGNRSCDSHNNVNIFYSIHYRDLLFLTPNFRSFFEEDFLVKIVSMETIHGNKVNETCPTEIISDSGNRSYNNNNNAYVNHNGTGDLGTFFSHNIFSRPMGENLSFFFTRTQNVRSTSALLMRVADLIFDSGNRSYDNNNTGNISSIIQGHRDTLFGTSIFRGRPGSL